VKQLLRFRRAIGAAEDDVAVLGGKEVDKPSGDVDLGPPNTHEQRGSDQ
jgi:hypothetical protein